MKKLNIIKIIDQWGWSYHFIGLEQQRYSRHNIIIQKYDNLNLDNADIVYIHGPNINTSFNNTIIPKLRNKNIKIIGGYGGFVNNTYSYADAIVTISPQTYNHVKEIYSNIPVIFLPESIDINYFTSKLHYNKNKFIVGYAGSKVSLKRIHLFEKLKYPVFMKTDWGTDYFVENRTQEHMKQFYKSIDVLILLSITECMPRVVLEAMAMGLPVITTDVGCMRMLLDKDWIVPVNPDEDVIKQTNEKLDYLFTHPIERNLIGLKNRLYIEENFSWKVTQPLWDDFFDSVYNNTKNVVNFPNYMMKFTKHSS